MDRLHVRLPSTAVAVVALLGAALSVHPADADATRPAGSAAPPPAASAVRDGTGGLGDSYFPSYGNSGYRVGHYGIRVAFNPRTERLRGTTHVRARATTRLTRFHLDLVLRASRVLVNGERARFDQTAHELVVRPAHAVRKGHPLRVEVIYAGKPGHRRLRGFTPWVTTRDGAVAVGEPEIAAWWFPSNDHPSDKASFDVAVTVPKRKQVVSNGRMVGKHVAHGKATFRWRANAPMAPYLAFIAIGDFRLLQGRAAGLPYVYAVSKELSPRVRSNALHSLRSTGAATRFLVHQWGRYPFAQIGGVVPGPVISDNFGYALENQTRPLYAPSSFSSGPARSLVVHEMAHQWFGDAVALRRWKHIWLNEGLATYSEWLWSGHRGGDTANEIFHRFYDNLEAGSGFWKMRIGDPGPERLFDNRVYDRGAMTAHALRTRIGDRDFFTTMRRWVHDNRDGLGTTEELRSLAQQVSGERLAGLFRAWLQTPRKPAATRANAVFD